jgi:DNA ligase-1
MVRFAVACEAISPISSKIAKIEKLADYLQSLDDADLEAAAYFFTGSPFARCEQKTLRLGGSTIIEAAKNVWNVRDADLTTAYREHGDLGSALSEFVRPPVDLGLFSETLTPASVKAIFEEIANAAGRAAGKRRLHLCQRLLASCKERLEAKYVIKITTGDLRIGLKEALVVEAIAKAFGAPTSDVRRAVMATGDIGSVAVAAREGALHGVRISYGVPIEFMLASPLQFGSSYRELSGGEWLIEDKFDGIRAQAHKADGTVRLFSRTANDVSHSYPEVIAALARIPEDFILDGEIVAQRNGMVLPFRYLQARLQRKTVTGDLMNEVPVAYMAFDALAIAERYLLDEPLTQRRGRLAKIITSGEHVALVHARVLDGENTTHVLHENFKAARERGHEGLVLKRADSPYHPGRRGKWWLKLKRELSTLDVVVVAVEWGHGKRAKVLSDYTFAVRGDGGQLVTIGKAYSGLTDAEIADLTQWFLQHQTGRRGHAIAVEPRVVLEVAFDIIQPSELHESGFSLRFPRIVRIRDDKPVEQIDTVRSVRKIYSAMLQREGVTQ